MQTVSVSHRFHVKVPRLFFPRTPLSGFCATSSTIHSAEDTLDFNMKHVMRFQVLNLSSETQKDCKLEQF